MLLGYVMVRVLMFVAVWAPISGLYYLIWFGVRSFSGFNEVWWHFSIVFFIDQTNYWLDCSFLLLFMYQSATWHLSSIGMPMTRKNLKTQSWSEFREMYSGTPNNYICYFSKSYAWIRYWAIHLVECECILHFISDSFTYSLYILLQL